MITPPDRPDGRAPDRKLRVETHGLDVIADTERKGTPRTLFWPWFGADVSILGLGHGAFALGFGISFWQALAAGVVGIVFSFLLCGFVTVAGKRGSAPTMVLGRAAYGVRGNRLPSVISWAPHRPLRRRTAHPTSPDPRRHRPRLGPGHQLHGNLAGQAGLPPPPPRPRRQIRPLGLRQPRRPGSPGPYLPRHPDTAPRQSPRTGNLTPSPATDEGAPL